jgi:hypothetical protein
MKLRRKIILKKYKQTIDEMYKQLALLQQHSTQSSQEFIERK